MQHPGRETRSRARRIRRALVVVALGLAGAAPATARAADYAAEVQADGPQAWWSMDETGGSQAVDGSGNGNHAVYRGGIALGRPGPVGNAALLDGVDDYLTAPASSSLDLDMGVTVEAWVRRLKSGWQVVVGKPGNGRSRFENYALWIDPDDRPVGYFGNGTSYFGVYSPVAVDTRWHHLAVTYDNAVARLYIDGVEVATSRSGVRLTPNPGPLNIGRELPNEHYRFGGLLDEVAVYGTALSAQRIQRHVGAAPRTEATTGPPGHPTPGSGAPDSPVERILRQVVLPRTVPDARTLRRRLQRALQRCERARPSRRAACRRRARARLIPTARLTLSRPAWVHFTFTRLAPGVRRGSTCRPVRSAKPRRRSCTARVRSGQWSVVSADGINRVALPQRIGGRALLRGRYRVAVWATGDMGGPAHLRTMHVTRTR